jgi:hypothetical protein
MASLSTSGRRNFPFVFYALAIRASCDMGKFKTFQRIHATYSRAQCYQMWAVLLNKDNFVNLYNMLVLLCSHK